MRSKILHSPKRFFGATVGNPVFFTTPNARSQGFKNHTFNCSQLQAFDKILVHYHDRNLKYFEANSAFQKSNKSDPGSLYLYSDTPYTPYKTVALYSLMGFWSDTLIDRDIAAEIIKPKASQSVSLETITDIRNQLGVRRMMPPLMCEITEMLNKEPSIPYDLSHNVIITAQHSKPADSFTDALIITLPILNMRSRLILMLASHFHEIFQLKNDQWLLEKTRNNKFRRLLSRLNSYRKSELEVHLQVRTYKTAGKIFKTNAELQSLTAQLLQELDLDHQCDNRQFSPDELLNIMESWCIPVTKIQATTTY